MNDQGSERHWWAKGPNATLHRRDGLVVGPTHNASTDEIGWGIWCHGRPLGFIPAERAPTRKDALTQVEVTYPLPAWIPPWGDGPAGSLVCWVEHEEDTAERWQGDTTAPDYLGEGTVWSVLPGILARARAASTLQGVTGFKGVTG